MAWKTSGYYKYGIKGIDPNYPDHREFSNIRESNNLSVDDNHCLFLWRIETTNKSIYTYPYAYYLCVAQKNKPADVGSATINGNIKYIDNGSESTTDFMYHRGFISTTSGFTQRADDGSMPITNVTLLMSFTQSYMAQAEGTVRLFDSDLPIFEDIESAQHYIKTGEGGIYNTNTATQFKLWIKGLDSPTYKLNWHNEALEERNFDFSNSKIYVKLSSDSGGTYLYPFKELEYNNGSIKFTWYDMDNEADTTIFYPWLELLIYAVYTDENGEEYESGYCHIKLRQKSSNFDTIYELGEQGSDGSTITVVNYEDDPEGYDDDDDDYHDPSDNEDDTPDDSTDITVSGEVCKTFKIEDIELKKLSQFLWSSDFFDNILLVNNSPIENIISLKALIGTVTTTGTSQALALGNVTTTANAIPCNESITINVGSITLPRKYNNFLDFEPYTKVQIYLPFYGCAMLDSSLVIGRTISIKYIIDVITATAKIKIIHDNKTLYEFKTTCGSDLPITSSNRASVEMGYLSSGVGMGISIASGNVLGGLASGLSMAQSQYHSSTSGNVSGVLNFHDSRMITILVDRPVYTELRNFNKTHGRVCNLSKTLRDLRGFTKCAENVQIPFNCLDEERSMIIEQLVNGVII